MVVIDDHRMTMAPNGTMLINVTTTLTIGRENKVEMLNFQERLEKGHLRYRHQQDVGLIEGVTELDILRKHNDKEFKRANDKLKELKQKQLKFPASEDINKLIKYHENVLGHFFIWYNAHNIKEPKISSEVIDKNKKQWAGTKSEFARLISKEYQNHQKYYSSERDATFKIFDKYEFNDKNWTKEKCYGLVRKV
jgi:hypothetical protein